MSAAFPVAVGPMILAALALIALLIPPVRPTVHDPDPVDEDELARSKSRAGGTFRVSRPLLARQASRRA